MNHAEVLVSNVTLVERLIEFVCHRHALRGPDAEDFAGHVKLKLVEDDYAILRRFEGQSSLTTYLSVVVQRIYLDHRKHEWGRWHPSREALRLGGPAVLLEALIRRDERPPGEAIQDVLKKYPDAPVGVLRNVLDRLSKGAPPPPHLRVVGTNLRKIASAQRPDTDLMQKEREMIGARASRALRKAIRTWPPDDRLLLRMRFGDGLTVVSIARMLQLDQKSLYKRLDRLLSCLREALAADGVQVEHLRYLLESEPPAIDLDFDALGNVRPARAYASHEEHHQDRLA